MNNTMNGLLALDGALPMRRRVRTSSRLAYYPRAHLLVVDDDPLFCRIMEKTGEAIDVLVTTCQSLEEIEVLALPEVFDAAVIDFYLDGIQSHLTGAYVAKALRKTPSVLVSADPYLARSSQIWPRNVEGFIVKATGPVAILKAALRLTLSRR